MSDAMDQVALFPMRPQLDHDCNPHRHTHVHERHHELLVVDGGRAHQLTRRGPVPCRVGEVYFFPAGQPHMSWCERGQHLEPLVLHIDRAAFAGEDAGSREAASVLRVLCEAVGDDNRLELGKAAAARLRSLLGETVRAFEGEGPAQRCLVRGLGMQALAIIAEGLTRRGQVGRSPRWQPGNGELVQRVLHLIACDYHRQLTVDDALAVCPLSRSRFHEVFKAEAGMTFGEALETQRLAEARRLLRETGESMLDIALRCGFGSQSHFNHRFRRAEGCTPRQYRSGVPA